MSINNSTRSGCKDVFRAFLVGDAEYEGKIEIPLIRRVNILPNKLISFSKSLCSNEYDAFIRFYEDDVNFERIWNKPNKYLEILKKFTGIISPDFSLYRDMPLVMQEWNTYRGRAIASWLQNKGIPVIPNVRWSDERSFEFCCLGTPSRSTISIGSHGCIKNTKDREYFKQGLEYVINRLVPHTIIVYGTTPDSIFNKYRKDGIIYYNSTVSVCVFIKKLGVSNGNRISRRFWTNFWR